MGFCPSARFQGISLAPCSLVVQSVHALRFKLANSTKLVFPQLQRFVDILCLPCSTAGIFEGLNSPVAALVAARQLYASHLHHP